MIDVSLKYTATARAKSQNSLETETKMFEREMICASKWFSSMPAYGGLLVRHHGVHRVLWRGVYRKTELHCWGNAPGRDHRSDC